MAYWLVKSEPGHWSWDDHVKVGVEPWNGVRNHQACNNMRAMKKGDLGFFYHSVKEKQVVGVVEVCAEVAPDPKPDDARWECVTLRAVAPFPRPVTHRPTERQRLRVGRQCPLFVAQGVVNPRPVVE